MVDQRCDSAAVSDGREACQRYLLRSGSAARLLDAPFGLHGDLDEALQLLLTSMRTFFAQIERQLQDLGLQQRLFLGVVDNAIDASEHGNGRQEAYAIADPFAVSGEFPFAFIVVSLPFVRDIFLAWDAMLSRRELFPEIGQPEAENAVLALVDSRPRDPQRAVYAQDQALLTIEFAMLHEFYHVASGHLDAIRKGDGPASLHAVHATQTQALAGARLYKVLELDADVMAMRHLSMDVLRGAKSVPHATLFDADPVARMRHVGRTTTLLFRLIELWRRHVRLEYTEADLHPHPDVRDASLHAYLRANGDPAADDLRSTLIAQAYARGQEDLIEALALMNMLAPSFEVVEGLGQDLAIREIEWLLPELHRVRQEGVGETDFRRRARRRQPASAV